MAHVSLIGNLRQYTGGVTELDVEAANVRQLFARLGEKFPELLPHLETGSAVAIDGQIYQDALFQPIGPDSDVHILPQIAGDEAYAAGPTRPASGPSILLIFRKVERARRLRRRRPVPRAGMSRTGRLAGSRPISRSRSARSMN